MKKKIKIAVNTRLLLKNKLEGIGWFTYESLKRITQQHKEVDFLFFFDRKFDDTFIFSDNITPISVFPQARHPFLYFWWFQMSMPYVLNKYKADMFLSPDGFGCLTSSKKQLVVIHDLNFEHYPENLPWLERNNYKFFVPRFAKKADRIATVSEFSKQDIINHYNIPENKIDVVYNGSNEEYKPVSEEIKKLTKQKYSNNCPFFVFVGSLHPRKNIANLFKAFDLFKQTDNQNHKLIIVGAKKWWTNDITEAYNNLQFQNDVIFTGRLEPEDFKHVLATATANMYVSIFEGFGIPIVESFYAEVPVITSNVTSMPEIAGNAALLVDPFSIQSIATAMTDISRDENLRNNLIELGKEQKNNFSWQKTADKLWLSIEKTLENS